MDSTPTPTDARDVEIATADFEYAVRNANETLGDTVYLTKAVVLRILNRLSAAEARNAELVARLTVKDPVQFSQQVKLLMWSRDSIEYANLERVINDQVAAKIAALEAELAALKAKLTPTTDDRECAEKLGIYRWGQMSRQQRIKIIAAYRESHCASRLAPIQAELDEAVGLLRTFLRFSADFCEIPPEELDDKAHRFLTRHQRDNAQGEG